MNISSPNCPAGVPEWLVDGRVALHCGDCREVLKAFADDSHDSCVTDPPYALVSVVQRFGNSPRSETTENVANPYGRTGRGFMGQKWDTGETAFDPAFWAQVLRVLKPGAHLVAFGGTRSYHRLACAIEDAGFEIRDQCAWVYGTGFPKSHDVSKGIDKAAGAEREVVGHVRAGIARASREGGEIVGGTAMEALKQAPVTLPATDAARQWEGWGTALKPAWEPICLARKPLSEKTVAANVLRWGTGAINVDGCRVGTTKDVPASASKTPNNIYGAGMTSLTGGTKSSGFDPNVGRFPANLCHDGSDEVLAAFPETTSGSRKAGEHNYFAGNGIYRESKVGPMPAIVGDSGSAARFFYSAKADADDRLGSKHPTVKPLDCIQYFVRLVTPPGGTVLEPFAGTGTTGEAAWREGFSAVLIERESAYQADIRNRMAHVLAPARVRKATIAKRKGKIEAPGGLFAEVRSC